MHKNLFLAQLKAVLILPFNVLVTIPALILYLNRELTGWRLNNAGWLIIGAVFILLGLYMFYGAIKLFNRVGEGSLAPWNPTRRLVVNGIYRHVRNPMIGSLLAVILGESIFFQSASLFIYGVIVFVVNHIYFSLSEEPGLIKRFGDEYIDYRKNVPRWIPRLKPWHPGDGGTDEDQGGRD